MPPARTSNAPQAPAQNDPIRIVGPFLGIDTETEENRLAPTQARDLCNVLLHRERIQKRFGVRERFDFTSGTVINQIQPIVNANGGVQVLAVENRSLRLIQGPFAVNTQVDATPGGFITDVGLGSIAQLGEKVYVALGIGGNWVVEQEGGVFTSARQAGIPAPLFHPVDSPPSVPWVTLFGNNLFDQWFMGQPIPSGYEREWTDGVYDFAVSLYHEPSRRESNATFANFTREFDPAGAGGGNGTSIVLQLESFSLEPEAIPPSSWTHYRVYCKPVRVDGEVVSDPVSGAALIGGETQYRLCSEIDKNDSKAAMETGVHNILLMTGRDFDNMTLGLDGADPLSVKGFGPFAPIKNGLPPESTSIVAYDSKILWASGSKIFFSEDLEGGTVAELDFIIPGEGREEPIKYMTVYQGRLVIFRETEIYILSGSIARQSNDSFVLGEPPPSVAFAIHQPVDYAGCINDGGVGAVEAGGILFFNGFDGLYTFNGQTATKISRRVDFFYRVTELTSRRLCTMTVDTLNGLLWIVFKGRQFSLCYDFKSKNVYGDVLGVWTVHQFVGTAQCVASAAPLGLGSTVPFDDRARALFVLDTKTFGEMREDEFEDNGSTYQWDYTTPFMDLGLLERNKRFQYLTTDYDGVGTLSIRARVKIKRNTNIEFSTSVNLSDSEDTGRRKVRLRARGTHLQVVFEGVVPLGGSAETPVIQGFSIEAERIGIR